jgi:hypothetical protein
VAEVLRLRQQAPLSKKSQDSFPGATAAQRARYDTVLARVRSLEAAVDKEQGRMRFLEELVALSHRIDVAALPSSFLTKKAPLAGALSELNEAAAAVVGRLKATPALLSKRARSDSHNASAALAAALVGAAQDDS